MGLSPRGRGNPMQGQRDWIDVQGLSPRGRGNRGKGLFVPIQRKRVYPRVGGATGLLSLHRW